ncbi:MAG TPA: c-type cytochrome [Gemmatimonadales bacterium]
MRAAGLLLIVALPLLLASCDQGQGGMNEAQAARLTGGDAQRGRDAVRRYGCGECHSIAGVPGANSLIGPPLTGIGKRAYVAGVLTNTPGNLVRWIRDPQGVDSLTAMPDMGVTEADARDIAAYLYSRP